MENPMPADGPAQARPRRPWRRRLLLGGAGLVLLALLIVAVAPMAFSKLGRGSIEKAFAARFHGRLELGGMSLGWTGRQKIESARLLDPEGNEVARASLDLPGLLSLAAGRGKKLGRIAVVASADLVADDAGVTNLDRALAPRAPSAAPTEPPPEGGGGGPSALERLEAEFDVTLERVSLSDAKTRAAGGPIVLENTVARATLQQGGTLDANVHGRLGGSAQGEIALVAKVERPFASPTSEAPPNVDLDLKLDNLPVALLDALARQQGRLSALLGENLSLQVRAAGTPTAGDLKADLQAPRAKLAVRAGLENGVLRALEGWALDASLDLQNEALQELVKESLPPGATLERKLPAAPLKLAVPRLSVPLADALEARAKGEDLVAALLSRLELGVRAELGGWALHAPAMLGSEEALGLNAVELELSVVPSGGAARGDLALRARVAETPEGTLAITASASDLAALQSASAGKGEARALARVELRRIPAALVERLAHAEGQLKGALGESVDLEVELDGGLAAGGAASGRLQLALQGAGSPLTLRVDGTLPAKDASAPARPVPPLEARGELSGLELAYAFLPEERRPLLVELLGTTLAFDLKSTAAGSDASALALELTGARTQVELAAEVSPTRVKIQGEPGLSVALRPTPAALDALLGPSLPAGASVALRDEGSAITFTARTLEVARPQPDAPEGADATAALLEALRAELEFTLPALVCSQPPASGAGDPLAVEVSGLRTLVTIEPASGLTAHASGAVSGQSAEGLELRVRAPNLKGLAAGAPAQPVEIEARASALPTALIDAFAAQKGLLVDVLGPSIDFELSGRWPDPQSPLRAQMRSTGAEVALSARFVDGVLVAEQQEGLTASTPLTPLYSQRIVGKLVPLLVDLSKPVGAPPVGLSVHNFRLPLNGDLRGLDADIGLDLNQVAYKLLPGMQLLSEVVGARTMNVPPIAVQIRQGVASYERIPVEVGGQSVAFRGKFDLVSLELDLAADVPLSLLGSKVSSELDKVRDLIDPSTPVPIAIKGTWKKPRVSIGKEFLEAALKGAAEGALQRGLKGLLDRKKGGG
jgi:hypothetical protein